MNEKIRHAFTYLLFYQHITNDNIKATSGADEISTEMMTKDFCQIMCAYI